MSKKVNELINKIEHIKLCYAYESDYEAFDAAIETLKHLKDFVDRRKVLMYIADVQLAASPADYSGIEQEKRKYTYVILDQLFQGVAEMQGPDVTAEKDGEEFRKDVMRISDIPESVRRQIREEENFESNKRNLLDQLRHRGLDVSEEELDSMADVAAERLETILSKNDPYWDAYWECAEEAIREVIQETES